MGRSAISARDEGCDLAASCINCPFPDCRYDVNPGGVKQMRREARDARIVALGAQGTPASAIATTTGISPRTVQRVLAGQR